MARGLEIDYETADRITVCVLKDHLEYLRRDIDWFDASDEDKVQLEQAYGYKPYVHPDDYIDAKKKYIPAIELLIKYFGGGVD